MSKLLKIILFAVSGFIGFLVIVVVALLFIVDPNVYKSRLEAVISGALGMEVRVGGRLGIAVFPGLHVTLEDMHIRNRGMDILSAKEARLGIYLFPLLRKEVRIENITLKHSRISIERSHDGKFNFDIPEAAGRILPALDMTKVSISDGTLIYADKQSGEGFETRDCSLNVHRLLLSSGKSSNLMKNLTFTSELACMEIRTRDFGVSNIKISGAGRDGVFDLNPVLIRAFGGQGSGSFRADFASAVPLYQVRFSLSQFHIEEFLKTLSPNKIAEGSMDFSTNLSMQGKSVKETMRTAHGEASLRGKEIMLDGIDLDRNLSRFESSQNFNLVDVGAFFFAGPFGLVVTKGYNFASIFQGSGGRSEIRTLVSNWKIELGTAQAQDVAMATSKNRIALQGALDFVNDRFNDVTMAVIDAKGCVSVRQKIVGTFQKPVVEKPNILKSLTGPAVNLLKKGRKLFPDGECEVFYAGSVAALK
jgi:uncharacterized protein involved in outer membrane biogenesis